MNQDEKTLTDDDEMRPEYDFSKLKLVGRGIYAKRFRAGVRIVLLNEDDESDHAELKLDDENEPDKGQRKDVRTTDNDSGY